MDEVEVVPMRLHRIMFCPLTMFLAVQIDPEALATDDLKMHYCRIGIFLLDSIVDI